MLTSLRSPSSVVDYAELRAKRDHTRRTIDCGRRFDILSLRTCALKLKVVPANRALQNPGLFKYEHYRQAALAVCAGILIRFLIAVPVYIETLSC